MIVYLSLLFALLLQLFQLSFSYQWLAPNFSLLVLLVWLIYLPGYLKLSHIFCFGLLCDVLLGSVLGEHSFVFLFVSYTVYSLLRPLRVSATSYQLVLILFILALAHFLTLLIKYAQGYYVSYLNHLWLIPCVSFLIWPLVKKICLDLLPDYMNDSHLKV